MIEAAITSSVLIVAVILLRTFCRGKISSRFQYALWSLVLLRLVIPFSLFQGSASVMNFIPKSDALNKTEYILPLSRALAEDTPNTAVKDGEVFDGNSFGYSVLSEDGETITRYCAKTTVEDILKSIWIAGTIAVGLWFAVVNTVFYRRLCRSRKLLAADCVLTVYVTEGITSPCLFGLFKPSVYLNEKALQSEQTQRCVLTHELCHYRHLDHIWSLFRGLCCAVYWWNPLVWVAAILSRRDSELACDESAITLLGEEKRFEYGRVLLNMIASRPSPSELMCTATTMTGGKKSIAKRLNMIVKAPKTWLPALIAAVLILGAAAGCAFTGAEKNVESNAAIEGVRYPASIEYPSYTLSRLSMGEVQTTKRALEGESKKIAQSLLMDGAAQSTIYKGVKISELEECFKITVDYKDGTSSSSYAYMLDGKPVLQEINGWCCKVNTGLYLSITDMVPLVYGSDGKLWTDEVVSKWNEEIAPQNVILEDVSPTRSYESVATMWARLWAKSFVENTSEGNPAKCTNAEIKSVRLHAESMEKENKRLIVSITLTVKPKNEGDFFAWHQYTGVLAPFDENVVYCTVEIRHRDDGRWQGVGFFTAWSEVDYWGYSYSNGWINTSLDLLRVYAYNSKEATDELYLKYLNRIDWHAFKKDSGDEGWDLLYKIIDRACIGTNSQKARSYPNDQMYRNLYIMKGAVRAGEDYAQDFSVILGKLRDHDEKLYKFCLTQLPEHELKELQRLCPDA